MSLATGCGAYFFVATGVYLVAPLLHPASKSMRTAAAIPAKSEQQKDAWKKYVELSLTAGKNSQDVPLQLELARAQRDLGLAQQALATYHKVIYLDPISLEAQYELGALAAATGDLTLAASQVTELARRWPHRPEPLLL